MMSLSSVEVAFAEKKQLLVTSALLFVVVFACFLPSLGVGLSGDDFTYLELLSTHPWEALSQGFTGRHMIYPVFGQHYRPMLTFSYLLDVFVFGINSVGLHFSNIVWHYCATLLVFLTSLQLLRSFHVPNKEAVSLWTAIVFAVHPYHCEAIDWWTAKNDIVVFVFIMLSFLLFLIGRTVSNKAYTLYSCLAFCIAIGSKESAAVVPLILFVFLLFCGNNNSFPEKLKTAFRQTMPFWLILASFLAIRTITLKTIIGGYYGLLDLPLPVRIDRYLDIAALGTLWCPIDPQAGTLANLIAIILSLVYAFALFSFARHVSANESKDVLKVFGFTFSLLLLAILPVILVWSPKSSLENYRLLYMASFPLSFIVPLLLLANQHVRKSHFLSIFLLSASYFVASAEFQNRWASATRALAGFQKSLALNLASLHEKQNLVLLSVPRDFNGCPLWLHFNTLRDMLQAPFLQHAQWQKLMALAPHFLGDHKLINLSRLREKLAYPNKFKLAYAVSTKTDLVLRDFDAQGASYIKRDSTPITIRATDGGVSKGIRYNLVNFGTPILSRDYQFIILSCKTVQGRSVRTGSPLLLSWKLPEVEFESSHNSCKIPRSWSSGNGTTSIHVGEQLDWLNCGKVEELRILTSDDSVVDSVTLLSDYNLVPELRNESGVFMDDSVLQAEKDGYFHFTYDVSHITAASHVRVEISPPFVEFASFSDTYADSQESKAVLKTFDLPGTNGKFALSNKLGSPVWHQIRIFAKDSKGKVVAYSSDPIYLQSEEGASPEKLWFAGE